MLLSPAEKKGPTSRGFFLHNKDTEEGRKDGKVGKARKAEIHPEGERGKREILKLLQVVRVVVLASMSIFEHSPNFFSLFLSSFFYLGLSASE
jgi:hypothetical protein